MAMQMSQPAIHVRPQPDIYTLLLVVANLLLLVAIGVVMYNLIVNYGMSFGQIFSGKLPGLTQ